MDLTQSLTDDQTALVGCALALLASGGVMWASYFVGQALHREHREASESRTTIPLPAASDRQPADNARPERRKAA